MLVVSAAKPVPSTVSVLLTAGYISSPGIFTGAAPTVVEIKDIKSSSVGCLSIDNAPAATETVIENGVVAILLPLELVSVWATTVVLVIALPVEKALTVRSTSKVWYITFCTKLPSDPVQEFMSILPSANLTSLNVSCDVL